MEAILLLVGVNTTAGRVLDVVFLDGTCTVEVSSGSMVCSNGVFVLIVGEAQGVGLTIDMTLSLTGY